MPVVRIRTHELAAKLRAESEKMKNCVRRALRRAAERWLQYLRESVDKQGITNTGGYRDGFKLKIYAGRVAVENDHPAAGVIENGCGPHPVSEEGQESIEQWCITKLGLSPEEAKRAVYPICRKIREQGQEPKFVVKRALPVLIRYHDEELRHELQSVNA